MMYWFELLVSNGVLVLLIIFLGAYLWVCAKHKRFKTLNIAHDTPYPFFGNFLKFFLQQESHPGRFIRLYEKYKHRSYFGVFEMREPVLIIADPALIRQVTVIDFDHFVNHSDVYNEKSLFGRTLNMLKNDKWRDMRAHLAPVFSPQNLRKMAYLIEECCMRATEHLRSSISFNTSKEVDIHDFFSRFVVDVSASTTFGMKTNSLVAVDNMFYQKVYKAFDTKFTIYIVFFLYGNFPKILKRLHDPLLNRNCVKYFTSLMQDFIEFRRKNHIERFDIIQILLEKRNSSNSSNSKENHGITSDEPNSFVEEEIVAQCLAILMDGLIKSSALASCAAIELAANPDCQDKLQSEIDSVQNDSRSKRIFYDDLETMSYLDMVVFETLRKWPTMHIMDRMCTKPYTLYDETNSHSVHLKPGDSIKIPLVALQNDPNYFPDPLSFCPERFSEERRGFIKPYTFFPFGVGPRNCIGTKLALMQVKAALVSIFSEYRAELPSGSVQQVLPKNKGVFLEPDVGFNIRLRRRDQVRFLR